MAVVTESLSAQAADVLELYNLYQLQFYLDRILANINLINTPPNAQIVTVVGGTLFKLAAQYYNDATQWALIAAANELTDPQLVGVNTLLIPPLNNQNTGGILNPS